MSFRLDGQGELIVTDANWRDFVQPAAGDDGPAYLPRDYAEAPRGCYEGSSTSFIDQLKRKWPRETWKERAKELEATKTRISDLLLAAPREWLNQYNTNFCWCYAVVHAVMIVRFLANLPWVRLSPQSVAAPVKGYRNIGGWGSQALTQIVREGVAPADVWPTATVEAGGTSEGHRQNMAAIDRRYYEPSRAAAKRVTVSEFGDLGERDWAAKMACLCERIPVPSGYNWMGHEMCSIDIVILDNGGLGCRDMDNYGRNGNYNTQILSESRGTADDAICPLVSPPKFAA